MTVSVRFFSPSFYPNIRPSEIKRTCNTVNNKPVEQNQFFRFTNVSSIRSAAAIWCNYHQAVTNQASYARQMLEDAFRQSAYKASNGTQVTKFERL
jgi:hypothetical protein